MCINSRSQGLNIDLPKAGLEPWTSRSEAERLPLDHEVLPSPTKREFSSSLPPAVNVSLRAHLDNASTLQYVTMSGRRVRKPDKYSLQECF
ncbi:hypothetical protein ElyMa_001026900 [Elysia marginata]|uniref:Uncharacterized protein n=1 Tax=Elysia marginata TaxID=1093978 RepID=A0AAV4HLK7_9GAST|nr:hypothetical protein ElyMa_001026900 [Elysia marginata]